MNSPVNWPSDLDAETGEAVELSDGPYFRIELSPSLEPFLMALAGDGDLWMFLSSQGGLTAGRVDAEGAIFPYVTADRLHEAAGSVGPVTLLRLTRDGEPHGWRPFDDRISPGTARRYLYKSLQGDRVQFEERHPELGLSLRYRWASNQELGWVRTVWIENLSETPIQLEALDGLRDVLPFGAPLALYQTSSVLVDAYKRCERDKESTLAIYSLTSAIVDRPAAVEELRANVVWSIVPPDTKVRTDPGAPMKWLRGEAPAGSTRLHGRPGAYWNLLEVDLPAGATVGWHQVLHMGLDAAQVVDLRERLRRDALAPAPSDPLGHLEDELASARKRLEAIVASADGRQKTADGRSCAHHFANVLFNSMRGGVLTADGSFPRDDFLDFLWTRNRTVCQEYRATIETMDERLTRPVLLEWARQQGSTDLVRLALEYLPMFFGRRHGDPSRPWNHFAIHVQDERGRPRLSYEGNWRDIFQNWEALAQSFPWALESMVTKFLNASSIDGFNPYRITRDGVEWEVEDPSDPWSFIGYWGDHQIIYLLRLLESLDRHDPKWIEGHLDARAYTYADIPYRLKPYDQLKADPHHTIDFAHEHAARIEARVGALGTDGRLLCEESGEIRNATLLEKLLVPMLCKLSNLVLDGGIWMNTQRPEWNDANNALVGRGVSVVTLAYLRRYLAFLKNRLANVEAESAGVAAEVVQWLRELQAALSAHENAPSRDATRRDVLRHQLLDDFGQAFERYRQQVYRPGRSGSETRLPFHEVRAFLDDFLRLVEESLLSNRRPDGLFTAYNILTVDQAPNQASIEALHLMLEGQVAGLSSGAVSSTECASLVERMFESPLYRVDQNSFLLYPIRERQGFLAENSPAETDLRRVELFARLLDAGDRRILLRDSLDGVHFHGSLQQSEDLRRVLDRLAQEPPWRAHVDRDRARAIQLFEEHFGHRSYTGRSGTMYGYEGIGCIYWHMVAKLLLSIQEIAVRAREEGEDADVQADLARVYYRVRSGLGFEKSVQEYGAFPTDPYSHTPLHAGARQPGMTGQVKEEILTRLGELGVFVRGGCIRFDPFLLREEEFFAASTEFEHLDMDGHCQSIALQEGELAFSYLQVPVIYRALDSEPMQIVVERQDSTTQSFADGGLDRATSAALFRRGHDIRCIRVGFSRERLWSA